MHLTGSEPPIAFAVTGYSRRIAAPSSRPFPARAD